MCRIHDYVAVILLATSLSAHALESDKFQILHIVSDSGTYNFKTGVDIYEGHVKVTQGSSHLLADKLVTKKNAHHKIKEAIAYGLQGVAHFWTQPKSGDPYMHAYAKIIKYYPLEMNASLEHEVRVTQGENHFQGELIHYNSHEQTITVPATANARASLVYYPEKN